MKIVLHEIGDCKYTLEIQKSITQNKTFINLTHQELVDLSFALNETLDEDTCCGDVCDFGEK